MVSGMQVLPETGGICSHPKSVGLVRPVRPVGSTSQTGQTCGSHQSDRCGQSSQNTIWTSPLDRSCQVDQDSYVERPNQSPDEGDMTYKGLHV
jgi:hypothetical protein